MTNIVISLAALSLPIVAFAHPHPHSDDLQIVRGVVGQAQQIVAGSGFSLNSGGESILIVFDQPFGDIPSVSVTVPNEAADFHANRITYVQSVTSEGARIVFGSNLQWSFIAIGQAAPPPPTPSCDADLDGNGMVDLVDLAILLAAFGAACN